MTKSTREIHNEASAAALAEIKNIFNCATTSQTAASQAEEIRACARRAHQATRTMRRAAAAMQTEASTRETVLCEALHGEVLDCEANQTTLLSYATTVKTSDTHSDPLTAARKALGAVESSISELCSHSREVPHDTSNAYLVTASATGGSPTTQPTTHDLL